MNKKTKWGIIILVGAGIIGGGIYSQLPKKNDELAAADKVMSGNQKRGKQVLNVNAKVIKPQSLTDEFTTTGVLLPDEEVDLSFETSGKIVEINFEEGTAVKKGQLLAKVNEYRFHLFQCGDDGHRNIHLNDRLHQRKRDLDEGLYLICAIDGGCLIENRIDVLDSGVVDQHAPSKSMPDQYDQYCPDRGVIAEPVDFAFAAKRLNEIVEQTEIRVVDEFP